MGLPPSKKDPSLRMWALGPSLKSALVDEHLSGQRNGFEALSFAFVCLIHHLASRSTRQDLAKAFLFAWDGAFVRSLSRIRSLSSRLNHFTRPSKRGGPRSLCKFPACLKPKRLGTIDTLSSNFAGGALRDAVAIQW